MRVVPVVSCVVASNPDDDGGAGGTTGCQVLVVGSCRLQPDTHRAAASTYRPSRCSPLHHFLSSSSVQVIAAEPPRSPHPASYGLVHFLSRRAVSPLPSHRCIPVGPLVEGNCQLTPTLVLVGTREASATSIALQTASFSLAAKPSWNLQLHQISLCSRCFVRLEGMQAANWPFGESWRGGKCLHISAHNYEQFILMSQNFSEDPGSIKQKSLVLSDTGTRISARQHRGSFRSRHHHDKKTVLQFGHHLSKVATPKKQLSRLGICLNCKTILIQGSREGLMIVSSMNHGTVVPFWFNSTGHHTIGHAMFLQNLS